ncbi:SPOR domain-containing protein [Gayadomonas joobiniege]|uniref:SPOR domain-containing protein n=1 Tax=Gayadomonas joobiniege TaxID=1234606 RepID=UPI00138ACFB1|nr:SPOR domain-containing protein [Gayadomonas joobiniege]
MQIKSLQEDVAELKKQLEHTQGGLDKIKQAEQDLTLIVETLSANNDIPTYQNNSRVQNGLLVKSEANSVLKMDNGETSTFESTNTSGEPLTQQTSNLQSFEQTAQANPSEDASHLAKESENTQNQQTYLQIKGKKTTQPETQTSGKRALLEPIKDFTNQNPFAVQLASLTTLKQSRAFWAEFKAKHNKIASGQTPRVQSIKKGPVAYYRVKLGPYTKQAATSICQQLKQQKNDCLITEFNGEKLF